MQSPQTFHTPQRSKKLITWGDVISIVLVLLLVYLGVRLAFHAPAVVTGPDISLSPSVLPWYTLLSVRRMAAAYVLSVIFTLVYGRIAAYNPRAERLLMPLLDVLQSVPILSFLPVVLLGLSAFLPENSAAEIASIVLIFTSQVWNLTFAWYQSLTTIPQELREASAIFRLNSWMKFKRLELPFGMISLIWNSMMSWAGGWFFLMAAEIFTVGEKDFRLAGLGAYLQEAANQSDYKAITYGVITLVLTVILLDQLIWRPLIAWADRFKLEMIEGENPPTSWFYNLMNNTRFLKAFSDRVINPMSESFDQFTLKRYPMKPEDKTGENKNRWVTILITIVGSIIALYGLFQAGEMLIILSIDQWSQIGLGLLFTFLRVTLALFLAMAWTIPVGVLIGTNQRLSTILQPIIQITASVPATALFPVLVLLFLNLKGGLNLAAVLLMLLGSQWYILFNVIAGVSAIPQDLRYTTKILQLNTWQRWRTLILPAIFPYLVTGAITASGGAWNASIVAEYLNFGGQTLSIPGIGALITQATATGDFPMLLAASFGMIVVVVLVNRLVWRRLYRLAEEKYRME